ncbi:MAG TPA: OmpA family protein [Zeimonas sp.]
MVERVRDVEQQRSRAVHRAPGRRGRPRFDKMIVSPFSIRCTSRRTTPERVPAKRPGATPGGDSASYVVQEESALHPETRTSPVAEVDNSTKRHAANAASGVVGRRPAEPEDGADATVRVYFEGDSTSVGDEYLELIREQAERFNTGPGGTLIVSGHANPVEEPEAAVQLSMSRTQAVAVLLERFGVQSHRIVRVSHGSNAPIVDVADETVCWVNRCVEIRHGGLTPRQPVWSQRTRKSTRR